MKAEDLKAKTPDELKKVLMDTRKAQMNLRFQRSGGQLENTAEIRKTRRNIARIKTMLAAQDNANTKPAKAAKAAAKKSPAKKAETKKSAKDAA